MNFDNLYLQQLLTTQKLTTIEDNSLQVIGRQIQSQLSVLGNHPQFYFAGSLGKQTMIRDRYDLDIVAYWPHSTKDSLETIYNSVGSVLKTKWRNVKSKTVCWEISFDGGFHIDVVPGRALDSDNYNANLYRTDTQTTLKTSLKKHIETVKNSNRSSAIKLMKLWRVRQNVPFQKSFLLELITIEGCKGKDFNDFSGQILGSLNYLYENIMYRDFIDPANSNNSLSDDLTQYQKRNIKDAAEVALGAKSLLDLFTHRLKK